MEGVEGDEGRDGRIHHLSARSAEADGRLGEHELAQHLAAGTAGTDGSLRIRRSDGQGDETPAAGSDGRHHGAPLGAYGQTEGTVLHVGARNDGPVLAEQRRPYAEAGIGGVGSLRRAPRGLEQFFHAHRYILKH